MFNFCRNQTENNNNNVAEQLVLGVIVGKVGICLYLFTFHLNQESSISRKYFTGVFFPSHFPGVAQRRAGMQFTCELCCFVIGSI